MYSTFLAGNHHIGTCCNTLVSTVTAAKKTIRAESGATNPGFTCPLSGVNEYDFALHK